MKSRDIASSATRSEPSQCQVVLVDAKSSHRASSALADEASTVCTSIEGRIHHVRGTARVACRLAKLLRHHRLRCGPAFGLAVRGHHLGFGGIGARVVAVERDSRLQHPER